jgi:hypothetical protein
MVTKGFISQYQEVDHTPNSQSTLNQLTSRRLEKEGEDSPKRRRREKRKT